MSIWFVIAVGVTLRGEPRGQGIPTPNKAACEQVREAFDKLLEEQGDFDHFTSKCVEIKIPEKS